MRYLVILFLFVSFTSFAQINFEAGYFVDLTDKRTECLIKNEGWLRSPSSIKYKISSTSEPITLDIAELKEFSVSNARYICATAKMDTSSQKVRSLTSSRTPRWATKHIALKTLIEGKANLYLYDNGELRLFFFSVDNSPIEQLEYKLYNMVDKKDNNMQKVVTNLNYINQLQTRLSCGKEISKVATHKMKYNENFLVGYFRQFNTCSGTESTSYLSDKKKNRQAFNLKLTPGVDFSTSRVQPVYLVIEKEYPGREASFRMGAEAQLILPFNKNKWAIWIEPTYQSYKTKSPRAIEYSSIEIPVGLKHHFFLNRDFKLFLGAACVFDFPIKYLAYGYSSTPVESNRTKVNFAAGVGIEYKRFSVEGRFYSTRAGYDDSQAYGIDFKKNSVILGYRVF